MQVAVRPATTSLAADTRVLAAGFFGLQFFVGYEWVMSGMSKALSGPDPNDQGVDLDSLMMIMQLVLVSVSVGAMWWIRRDARQS